MNRRTPRPGDTVVLQLSELSPASLLELRKRVKAGEDEEAVRVELLRAEGKAIEAVL